MQVWALIHNFRLFQINIIVSHLSLVVVFIFLCEMMTFFMVTALILVLMSIRDGRNIVMCQAGGASLSDINWSQHIGYQYQLKFNWYGHP